MRPAVAGRDLERHLQQFADAMMEGVKLNGELYCDVLQAVSS